MTSKIFTLVKERVETDILARLVSDLLNPLIMPPLVLGVVGYSIQLPNSQLFLLLSITVLFFSLLPLISAISLSKNSKTDSLDFILKASRKLLYGISALSSFAGVLLIVLLFNQLFLKQIAIIFLINLIIALLLNFRWKISVHNAAVTTAGACLILYGWFTPGIIYPAAIGLVLLCAVLPVVSWSRYRLNVHTIPELLGGLAIGIIPTGITAIFWYII